MKLLENDKTIKKRETARDKRGGINKSVLTKL